jgi:hypothetical protein
MLIYSNMADFKNLFQRSDELKANWENGVFKIVTFKGHKEK